MRHKKLLPYFYAVILVIFALSLTSSNPVFTIRAEAAKKARRYEYKKDLGRKNVFKIICEENPSERKKGEFFSTYVFKVSVYKEGEEKPFQTFKMDTNLDTGNPFSFDDINADGYLDLCCQGYYGANGGWCKWRVFSPSKNKLVKISSKIFSHYSGYGVDAEKRRLLIHEHGSAVSGSELTWQWSGETDAKLIRKFSHDEKTVKGKQTVHVRIVDFSGKKKETICDYNYKLKYYNKNMSDIYGLDSDFLWKKKVKKNGKIFTLRYCQEPLRNKKGKRITGYQSYVYVLDKKTRLVKVLKWKDSAKYKSGSAKQIVRKFLKK